MNRVLKREYVEIPDPGSRLDSVVRDELWLCHKKRNDSVVVDTLTGVLKSTITCPQCATPWRKFDVFNTLELPLPLRDTRSLKVVLVRRVPATLHTLPSSAAVPAIASASSGGGNGASGGRGGDAAAASIAAAAVRETVYAVEIHKKSTLHDVRMQVAAMSGLPAERLFFWETYGGKVFQLLNNKPKFLVSKLASTDVLVASELPDWPKLARRDDTGTLSPPPSQDRGKALRAKERGATKAARAAASRAQKKSAEDSDGTGWRDGPPSSDSNDDDDDTESGTDENDDDDVAEGGTVTVLMMHRRGGAQQKHVRTFRGTQVQDASVYFGKPLVVAARTEWTVLELKRHVVAQLAPLLGPFDDVRNEAGEDEAADGDGLKKRMRCLSVLSKELPMAQVASLEGEPKTGQFPLANRHYRNAETNSLTLRQAFPDELGRPSAHGDMVVGVALEWSEDLITFAHGLDPVLFPNTNAADADNDEDDEMAAVVGAAGGGQAATTTVPQVHYHPSVKKLAHLDEALSLRSCFGAYCADEEMEEGEEYYCGKCKAHQPRSVLMSI